MKKHQVTAHHWQATKDEAKAGTPENIPRILLVVHAENES